MVFQTWCVSVKNITVLGSGVMGHGIAQVSATAGYNVVLRDIKQEFLDKAMEKIKWSLDKLVTKEKISKEEGDTIYSRITPIVDLSEAVKDAEMIIEVVPEIMDLKKQVYAELDKVAKPEVVFASNTSTLPITEIANTTSRPEKFIGIHFFNPPQLMKLVEIIPGEKTSQEITDMTQEFVKSVNKEAVLCRKDVPGFIINRLFIPMVHEACYLKDRTNATLEEIDSAVKFKLGFPMGIFELADFTGMDVIHKATVEMHLRDKKVINPHTTVEKMFDEKKLGQKSGEGYYKYSDDKYERVELSEELAQKCNPIQLVANILNNAAWLISNGASDIEEIEKACKLGLGLRKPLFETAKEIGIKNIVEELNKLAEEHGEFYKPDPLLESMV
jgi:enoyl-CoA hydratase / 3-hydroxyacyl-CoA dehydrogenase